MIKLILISTIILLACAQDDPTSYCKEADGFDRFLKHFNIKNYTDINEYNFRKQIFWGNCSAVEAHNSQPGVKFQIGINLHSHQKLEEYTPPKLKIDPKMRYSVPNSLPKQSDGFLTSLGKAVGLNFATKAFKDWQALNKVTPVKNQGSCGSCWTFSTTAAYESGLLRTTGVVYDLAEQYTLECTNSFPGNTMQSSCGGGYVNQALAMITSTGMPKQSTYPYAASTFTGGSGAPSTITQCSKNVSNIVMTYPNKTLASFNGYYNLTFDQINTLLQSGTLVVLIYADSTFQSYKSGVFNCPASFANAYNSINHAVELVGIDANGNYVIKNSWDKTWGVKGFGFINPAADCAVSAFVYQISSETRIWISFALFIAFSLLF